MAELDLKDLQSSIADLTTVINQLIPQMNGVRNTTSSQRQASNKASEETIKLNQEYRKLQNSVRTNNSLMSGMRSNLLAVGISYYQEIQLSKKKIQLRQSELADAQRNLAENSKEIATKKQKLNELKQEIASSQQLRSEVTKQINTIKTSIAETQQNINSTRAEKTLKEQSIAAIREKLASAKDEVNYTKSAISAAQQEHAAVAANVKALEEKKNVQKSQIAAINTQIKAIEGSPSSNKKLTAEEQNLVKELTARKESIHAAFESTKAIRQAEIAYRESLASTITSLQSTLGPLEDAEKSLVDTLVDETLTHKNITDVLNTQESALQQLTNEQAQAEKEYQTLTGQISKTIQAAGKESVAIQNATKAHNKLQEAAEDAAENLRNASLEKLKTHIDKIGELRAPIDMMVRFIRSFTDEIRKTQQQFGIAAGQAAKLKLENLTQSVKSYVDSLKSGFTKAGVSAEEIQTAQADFQAEFGGVLTSKAASDLASQAKMMGVTTGQLAQARRVFMTQTMGDAGKAKAAQEKFIGEFAKKGLTAKDAMAAIGQNAELLARNGTRFASSFARAAADAKKIGVDLSKIDQVGDNIIGDFEGFLEKTSELGAMGFNLDTTKLAELAESGDTGALFGELRSQLAATGKDITKLRRSERMALESTFGINISELQRMGAEGTEGSGEEQKSVEALQADSNTLLTKIVNALEPLAGLLGGISKALEFAQGALQVVLLGRIAMNTARMGLPGGGGSTGGPTGGLLNKAGSAIKLGSSGLTMGSSVGAAAGAGATGLAAIGGTVVGGLGAGLAIGNMFNTSVKEGGSGTLGDWWNSAVGKSKEEKEADRKADAFAQSKGFKSMAEMLAAKKKSRGDDVISQPGYGKRSLVTPSGVIALNNKDNVVAYADDLMGNTKLPFGSIAEQAEKLEKFKTRVTEIFDGMISSSGPLGNIEKFVKTDLLAATTGKFASIKEGISGLFGDKTGGLMGSVTKFTDGLREKAAGLTAKIPGLSGLMSGGGIAELGKNLGQKASGLANKIPGMSTLLGEGSIKDKAMGLASKIPGLGSLVSGGVEGAKKKALDIANKIPGVSSLVSGGIGGLGANLGQKAMGFANKIPGMSTLLGEGSLKDKAMGFASKIPGVSGLMSGGISGVKENAMGLASKIPGVGGLLSGGMGGLKEKAIGLGAKIPGVGGLLGGGMGGLKEKALGVATKIPGLGSISGVGNVLGALKSGGGIKGVGSSLAKAGVGKVLGGAIGTAIPIPGVGTAIGSLVGSKLGKFAGGLFGRKKQETPTVSPEMMTAPSPDLSMMVAPQAKQQPTVIEQKPATVDTSGIEKQLGAFINALANIQINMDGVKVGNTLVNSSNAATSLGVMNVQSRVASR